jgi:hypothetical protein
MAEPGKRGGGFRPGSAADIRVKRRARKLLGLPPGNRRTPRERDFPNEGAGAGKLATTAQAQAGRSLEPMCAPGREAANR